MEWVVARVERVECAETGRDRVTLLTDNPTPHPTSSFPSTRKGAPIPRTQLRGGAIFTPNCLSL